MSADFLVTVHDPARRVLWETLLGTDTVPVRSFVPTRGLIEGQETDVFVLDAHALTIEQRHRLVSGLAERFLVEPAEIMASLDAEGIAIPTVACSVMVLHPQRWTG